MNRIPTIVLAVSLGLALPIGATAAEDGATQRGRAKSMDSAAPMSAGEVRKVDKSSGKVTIKHGPLDNLGMPAMTMVFRVKDPAMLDQMKEGDKINFVAEKVNGALTVIQVEPAK
jgi:Cu(I)/Ag(I) efflux system protein CusF